jgi:arylsulfatase A
MSRLSLSLLAVAAMFSAGLYRTAVAADAARPNVILIMADDLGYETIGANGGTSYKTPVLDRLAAEGVRFDRCYVQPLCTPTRMQLMTGAYNVRNYVDFGSMNPKLKTFGNLFRDAGYKTGIVGKWQLGQAADLPKTFGFDDACLWQHTRRPPRYANAGVEINGVEKDFTDGTYGPDVVNDYACEFVRKHKSEPFFLYYPMMLTHSPYQPTPDSPDYDKTAMGENVNKHERHFGEMVEYMDKLIGRLDRTLQETGVRENTLLIFLGDNGTGSGTKSMMGDKVVIGAKGTTNEFGMRVPSIVSWPGHAATGKVCPDLVASVDFLPTICDAAGIKVPVDNMLIDGQSFLPQVFGKTGQPREWIYSWYCPRQENLREFAFDHNFKLYTTGEFYDLRTDLTEKQPLKVDALAGEAAAAAKKLRGALDQYAQARPASLPTPKPAAAGAKRERRRQQQAE